MTRSSTASALFAALLLLATGCDRYDRLDRPLPRFKATTLDGRTVDAAFFEGKPWVVNIWVPG